MRRFSLLVVVFSMCLFGVSAVRTAEGAAGGADPLVWGRHKVVSETYDLGDRAFKLPGGLGRAELAGVVHHPRGPRGKRFPMVVFLHGLYDTCTGGGDAGTSWPCPRGSRAIPSYRGFDYIGRRLASHGYVVVSISANGINAPDHGGPSREGMNARGLLVQKHLDLWKQWSAKGGKPFGKRFLGAIDFMRVGTMGHSRGGEGVVRHYEINAARGRPYGVRAVLPLDPSDFFRPVATGTAMAVVLARCGGKGIGVEYYDDARYRLAGDRGAKHTVTVMGANHNYFNTVWTQDDWRGDRRSACHPSRPTRLTAAQQRNVGIAYVAGFFRSHLGGERALAPMWRGETVPRSIAPAKVLVSRLAPSRRDVNRLRGAADLRRNALGGKVTTIGAASVKLCGGPRRLTCLRRPGASATEPHQGTADAPGPGLSVLKISWSGKASYTNAIPARHGNVRRFRAIVLRGALDFTDPGNPRGRPQNVRIKLTDARGRTASAATVRHSAALGFPPPVGADEETPFLLNQVRVPLSAFRGVDLRNVRGVSLDFGTTTKGSIGITDLAFTE
ncbi:hypothetical protein ACGFNU_36005 [Spirillospora sp. NPDC048911]|uniref:hypothetical protein n=1 Tax=Spirillospora sp. NPDC048911 TaxID=3364527 RepID=UPI0037216295